MATTTRATAKLVSPKSRVGIVSTPAVATTHTVSTPISTALAAVSTTVTAPSATTTISTAARSISTANAAASVSSVAATYAISASDVLPTTNHTNYCQATWAKLRYPCSLVSLHRLLARLLLAHHHRIAIRIGDA